MFRQTAEFPRDPGHDVTWVSDDDDDSIRTVLDQFGDDVLEDSNVVLYEVKTRLSFFLTSSSCYDDHARILQPQLLYTVIMVRSSFSLVLQSSSVHRLPVLW